MNVLGTLKHAGVATLLAVCALASHAGPILWVSTGGAQLATVDVATGATTLIGNTGTALTDIAFNPNGDLYGISFSDLYKVNQSTGATTLIGSLGAVAGTANALVFGANGTLYMAGSSLYTVNTTTGAATAVGSGIGFQSGGDLAFIGNDLFMASSGNLLIDVDITTGSGAAVGNLGVANMFGLATPDNAVLYGVAGQSVYTVNTVTGAAALASNFNPNLGGGAFGLAFRSESGGSVPEPATLALVGMAMLGLAASRRRA